MRLTIDDQPRDLVPIKTFRAEHNLPPDFGVALFDPKDWTGLGRIDRAGAELNRVRKAMLDGLPAEMNARGWLTFLAEYTRLFETSLYDINAQVGLKDVEIEFAVAGLSDVLQAAAYELILTPPPSPLPASEEGESKRADLLNQASGMKRIIKTPVPWQTPRELYDALKLLARQKRNAPTPAEKHLWQLIRDKQLQGHKFRRQHTIDRFIVDFYCSEAKLVIEVDGGIHEYTVEEDQIRQAYLESLGLRVIRFTNDEVFQHTDSVIKHIVEVLQLLTPPLAPPRKQGGEAEDARIDSPSSLAGRGMGGGVNRSAQFFHRVYATWLDNSVRVFTERYTYSHQGDTWDIQLFAHAYGRAGLIVHTSDATYYVSDPALACPAEGFMAALIGEIIERMLTVTR